MPALPSSCSIAGCGGRRHARSWCFAHYMRWRRHGDPLGAAAPRPPRSCSVDGCTAPYLARGYCASHYARWSTHGDPLGARPVLGPCSVDGCERPHAARSWCSMHYARWRKHGDPLAPPRRGPAPSRFCAAGCGARVQLAGRRCWDCWSAVRRRRAAAPRPCSVDGCERERERFGLCAPCYRRRFSSSYRRHTAALLDAAGGRCALCGEPIDTSAGAPLGMRPSIDHVLPRSAGGSDELANLRIAHYSCNAARHDRVDVHATAPPSARKG